jgi:hypothetical protein
LVVDADSAEIDSLMFQSKSSTLDFETNILKGSQGSSGVFNDTTMCNELRGQQMTDKIRVIAEKCEYGVGGFMIYNSLSGSMGTFGLGELSNNFGKADKLFIS